MCFCVSVRVSVCVWRCVLVFMPVGINVVWQREWLLFIFLNRHITEKIMWNDHTKTHTHKCTPSHASECLPLRSCKSALVSTWNSLQLAPSKWQQTSTCSHLYSSSHPRAFSVTFISLFVINLSVNAPKPGPAGIHGNTCTYTHMQTR